MNEARKDVATKAAAPQQPTTQTATQPIGQPAAEPETSGRSTSSVQEEAKLLRRLQMMMNMVMGVIAQDNTLSYDEAAAMVADARTAALAMFPGKELAYDLIWRPRFQRLMRERFRLV